MLLDTLKTFAMHHLPWIVLVVVGGIGVRAYMAEHDAHLLADQKVAVAEQQVKQLQVSIDQNNQAILSLQAQMNTRDQQNAAVIQQLLKQKAAAVTPPQQVVAVQTIAKLPAPIESIPNTPDWRLPGIDVQPLFNVVADGEMAITNLKTCQSDLTDQKTISATKDKTITDQTQQIGLKDQEIAVLKKPKGFWKSFAHDLKSVGIGIGVGLTVAKFL